MIIKYLIHGASKYSPNRGCILEIKTDLYLRTLINLMAPTKSLTEMINPRYFVYHYYIIIYFKPKGLFEKLYTPGMYHMRADTPVS